MLRFFRTLRRRLLAENRLSQYLLYAIGEIILVVIGILIAIQINSMREESRARAYEKKILKEILTSLTSERLRFESYVEDAKTSERSVGRLVEFLNEDRPVDDSVVLDIQKLRLKNFLVHNQGAYESLKSGGLERITNDSIRLGLSNLFENNFRGAQFMINTNLYQLIFTVETDYQDLFYNGLQTDAAGVVRERAILPEREVLESRTFSMMLRRSNEVARRLQQAYSYYLIRPINDLERLIEAELHKN